MYFLKKTYGERELFMKKHLIPLMFAVMALYSAAGAQPPGYSASDIPISRISGTGSIGIAQVWGEQLKPPASIPRAIINLKDALLRWTNLSATVENQLLLGNSDLSGFPVLFISADTAFQLTETEKKNLKEYLKKGGFLVVDNAAAAKDNSPAGASLKEMIKDAVGSSRLEPIPNSNPIFHTPFELGGPPAGDVYNWQQVGLDRSNKPVMKIPEESKSLLGASVNGKLAVVYSNMGYSVKWSAETGNDPQLKLGVNLILYAMNQKKGSK